jgi:hypothetical protein
MSAVLEAVPIEAVPAAAPPQDPFHPLREVLERWFYKPDLQAIRIVLGTIKSHYLNLGDPAWLFAVAPPGSGKTSISIVGASGLPEVQVLGDLSENTFLSGFYGHQPGLLEKLGNTTSNGNAHTTVGDGILLMKDFTTVLSMRGDRRNAILGQLREIHDGQFRRDFGTGETKIWRGRVTIVAAVTPVLDRHYSIFSTLGERFLQVRWHRPDSVEAGEWAIRQQEMGDVIREACGTAVKQVFDNALTRTPRLSREQEARLASVAEVVAIGRTHVFRNGYGNREIEFVPEPESNTRISRGLAAIARGIAALSGNGEVAEEDLQDAFRVGLDCLPAQRRQILVAAIRNESLNAIPLARTVLTRQLEELRELKMLDGEALTEQVRQLIVNGGVELENRR